MATTKKKPGAKRQSSSNKSAAKKGGGKGRGTPRVGISLSSEEHGPDALVRYAGMAADHGFRDIWVSDHFHPWTNRQGESPFVWSVLGGIASIAPELRIGTGVTCPTMRIHPAIIAQAAASTAIMAKGGFYLGVGTGENLNEHILGDRWPAADERLEMLEEAIEVMRLLWQGGTQSHRGRHYRVENAQIYSMPDEPPPIYVSAFGPKACSLAARVGDGLVTTSPDADILKQYRKEGGRGPAIAGPKVCWAADEASAARTAFELWPTMGVPGELSQELATPAHFEQACELVEQDDALSSLPMGPDPEKHAVSLRQFLDAGFDEVYVHQIGTEQEPFMAFYRDEVIPRLGL
ncbi:MAG: TIGR03557 family F420-dependent LLM class oxidoreductase [Acidimicrobiales bacterium]